MEPAYFCSISRSDAAEEVAVETHLRTILHQNKLFIQLKSSKLSCPTFYHAFKWLPK